MRIGELPLGASLLFGLYEDDEIEWMKVTDNSDFISVSRIGVKHFDNIEPDNVSRARRKFGNNFFPHSNIAQYLNSSGYDWYHPAHEYDMMPRYHDMPGFLSGFSQSELNAIEDREITIAVPLGSRKEFGRNHKARYKVCLPAASEIGFPDSDLSVEGERIQPIHDFLNRTGESMMTRTGVREGGHIIVYYRTSPEDVFASRGTALHPMIRINPDTEISDTPNESGRFYIPDPDLMAKFMEVLLSD